MFTLWSMRQCYLLLLDMSPRDIVTFYHGTSRMSHGTCYILPRNKCYISPWDKQDAPWDMLYSTKEQMLHFTMGKTQCPMGHIMFYQGTNRMYHGTNIIIPCKAPNWREGQTKTLCHFVMNKDPPTFIFYAHLWTLCDNGLELYTKVMWFRQR
jgi:hypothetical protein